MDHSRQRICQRQGFATAAVELGRRHPDSICVALHPGTVDTGLTSPFNKAGLEVQSPDAAAGRLLAVIDRLSPGDSTPNQEIRSNQGIVIRG